MHQPRSRRLEFLDGVLHRHFILRRPRRVAFISGFGVPADDVRWSGIVGLDDLELARRALTTGPLAALALVRRHRPLLSSRSDRLATGRRTLARRARVRARARGAHADATRSPKESRALSPDAGEVVEVPTASVLDRGSVVRRRTRALRFDATTQLGFRLRLRESRALARPSLGAELPVDERVAGAPLAVPRLAPGGSASRRDGY